MGITFILLTLLAVVLEAVWIVVRIEGDLRAHVPATIELLLTSSIFYLISCYLVLRIRNLSSRGWLLLFGAAVVFRVTVWPVFPAFSEDVFRYRWEGRVQAAGVNPYQARPNDARLGSFRDSAFPRIPAPDFKAGYGPLLELEEALTYRIVSAFTADPERQVFWFKAPGALFDLAVMAVLPGLLRRKGLPPERALIYAWCPLSVFEFWISGHHDSIVSCLTLLALLAAARAKWLRSFGWLSLAAAAKFWPLLLFPAFARAAGRRRAWLALAAIPVFAAAAWPYRGDVIENARFMTGFVGGWRNNDSFFGILAAVAGDQYRAKYLAFAILIGFVLKFSVRPLPLERASLFIVVALLLISANCHPWYLTWFLPFLCLIPSPSLLLWTALMPLTYSVLIGWYRLGEWNGSTAMRWYVYAPFFAAAAAFSALRVFAPSKMESGRIEIEVRP